MSLIPLDDRRGDEEPTPPEGRTQHTTVGRLWDRLRSVLTRATHRLGIRPATDEGSHGTVQALPEETRVEPGETSETLRTDLQLVSSENGETLTVTDADNPDATITSDTWETVER